MPNWIRNIIKKNLEAYHLTPYISIRFNIILFRPLKMMSGRHRDIVQNFVNAGFEEAEILTDSGELLSAVPPYDLLKTFCKINFTKA